MNIVNSALLLFLPIVTLAQSDPVYVIKTVAGSGAGLTSNGRPSALEKDIDVVSGPEADVALPYSVAVGPDGSIYSRNAP
jgi:hypothetical protein